jgi:hypothetical protein
MINIKIPRLSQLIPWLIIIALLISLGYCGNRLDNETAARKRDNELAAKTNADQAAEIEKRKAWELRYHEQAAKQQDIAQQAAKKADSISKVARVQSQEIRQLYAELGQPWPETDTASLALRAKRCCSLAVQREEEYTALAVADSIKDHAYLEQIDLASRTGTTRYSTAYAVSPPKPANRGRRYLQVLPVALRRGLDGVGFHSNTAGRVERITGWKRDLRRGVCTTAAGYCALFHYVKRDRYACIMY